MATARAAYRAALPVLALAALLFLLAPAAAQSHAQAVVTGTAAAEHGNNLMKAQQRGLLAEEPTATVVERKDITKAALVKLLDSGVVPTSVPGKDTGATKGAPAGGRKLSQYDDGYCGNNYFYCTNGCDLTCRGSRGFCNTTAWRCRGSRTVWYCPCGAALVCYRNRSGLYTTCLF